MIKPTFFVNPGDELFIPSVSHPGEDAGADIRAHVKGAYSEGEASRFYRHWLKEFVRSHAGLFIDGEEVNPQPETTFLEILEAKGGGVMLAPGQTVKVNSGFKVILPDLSSLGHPWNLLLPVYKIVPRSGLANNHGIVVTNSPGIIDAGYQDWVQVSLTNRVSSGTCGDHFHVFTHGSRIAQGLCELVIDQSDSPHTSDPSAFKSTSRGVGGFGSTSV